MSPGQVGIPPAGEQKEKAEVAESSGILMLPGSRQADGYPPSVRFGKVPSLHPVEAAQFIRIIDSQADRMRKLISELLDVVRIETGSLSVAPEP